MYFVRILVVFLVAVTLSACNKQEKFNTNTSNDIVATPKKLFVIGTVGREINADFWNAFKGKFEQQMNVCGVAMNFFFANSLDLNPNARNAAIGAFQPDLVLIGSPDGGTKDERGNLITVNYLFEVQNVATKRPIWKGDLSTEDRYATLTERGANVAVSVLKQLQADRIIRSCGT